MSTENGHNMVQYVALPLPTAAISTGSTFESESYTTATAIHAQVRRPLYMWPVLRLLEHCVLNCELAKKGFSSSESLLAYGMVCSLVNDVQYSAGDFG